MNTELKEKMQKAAAGHAKPYRGYDYSEAPAVDIENAYMSGAAAMYSELAPLVGWVSVEDGLPEKYKEVLIKCEMWGEIIIVSGHISSMGIFFTRFGSGNNEELVNVTHWKKIEL